MNLFPNLSVLAKIRSIYASTSNYWRKPIATLPFWRWTSALFARRNDRFVIVGFASPPFAADSWQLSIPPTGPAGRLYALGVRTNRLRQLAKTAMAHRLWRAKTLLLLLLGAVHARQMLNALPLRRITAVVAAALILPGWRTAVFFAIACDHARTLVDTWKESFTVLNCAWLFLWF